MTTDSAPAPLDDAASPTLLVIGVIGRGKSHPDRLRVLLDRADSSASPAAAAPAAGARP